MPLALFYPTIYRRRITDITLDDLEELGVRGLLLDVDNTLTTHGSQHLSPEVWNWLRDMQRAGIGLTVVSNALPSRVGPFAEKIGLRYTAFSCKPSPIGFWRGVKRLGLPKRQVAAVGDQVFTDIVGANLCGIPCILLEPVELETGKPTLAIKRRLERWLKDRRDRKIQNRNV